MLSHLKSPINDFDVERAEARPISSRSNGGLGLDKIGWKSRSLIWGKPVDEDKGGSVEKMVSGCPGPAGGEATKPPLLLTAAGDVNQNFTLRQLRVREGEGNFPGWGTEMWWWDQWNGWEWSGPLSPVYFCLGCQQGGEGGESNLET